MCHREPAELPEDKTPPIENPLEVDETFGDFSAIVSANEYTGAIPVLPFDTEEEENEKSNNL